MSDLSENLRIKRNGSPHRQLSQEKWDRRFLGLAGEVASWSSDPSTKVGAVIVNEDNVVISTGWNGFPRGIDDTDERLNDRDWKLKHVVHAEINSITNAARVGARTLSATLYVHGLPPCSDCAKSIVQSGISRLVYRCPVKKPEWVESFRTSAALFNEVGLTCEEIY